MTITKSCPVKRAQYGFMIQRQSPMPKGLTGLNGSQAMEMQHIPAMVDWHELRVFNPENYEFYCVYCGWIDTNINWVRVLEADSADSRHP